MQYGQTLHILSYETEHYQNVSKGLASKYYQNKSYKGPFSRAWTLGSMSRVYNAWVHWPVFTTDTKMPHQTWNTTSVHQEKIIGFPQFSYITATHTASTRKITSHLTCSICSYNEPFLHQLPSLCTRYFPTNIITKKISRRGWRWMDLHGNMITIYLRSVINFHKENFHSIVFCFQW